MIDPLDDEVADELVATAPSSQDGPLKPEGDSTPE